MDVSFWTSVSSSWQSVQWNAMEAAVDLDAVLSALGSDIEQVRESEEEYVVSELSLDDDFWGGL
ncbi:hypothetical protein [Ectobacillus ponti]|uniref:Uncharacterized protein n=1 Tax=Ectobacillus ponti TaxID=2961894 RepID=A0AA41XC34_9BACI|nr:hypothetical protein [Ectobacillus ponti]MCP8970938.1 hypothetical protein [Ectobacillus ponti]